MSSARAAREQFEADRERERIPDEPPYSDAWRASVARIKWRDILTNNDDLRDRVSEFADLAIPDVRPKDCRADDVDAAYGMERMYRMPMRKDLIRRPAAAYMMGAVPRLGKDSPMSMLPLSLTARIMGYARMSVPTKEQIEWDARGLVMGMEESISQANYLKQEIAELTAVLSRAADMSPTENMARISAGHTADGLRKLREDLLKVKRTFDAKLAEYRTLINSRDSDVARRATGYMSSTKITNKWQREARMAGREDEDQVDSIADIISYRW